MDAPSAFYPQPAADLILRRYQGEQDLPAMLEVFQTARFTGQGLDHDEMALDNLNDISHKFRHLSNCDPFQDVLIAEIDRQMAAYARVNWRQLEPRGEYPRGCRIYFMEWYIRPEWRDRGLDSLFLKHCQERLRQIMDAQDSRSPFDGPRLFEANATSLQPDLIRLLQHDGFTPARRGSKMTCFNLENTPDLPLPPGFKTRAVKPEHYRQIWDALIDGFSDDPGFYEPSEEDYESWRYSAQFQPDLWQIAWDGNEVAGMVLNYITRASAIGAASSGEPGIAWTEDICVRPAYRRRGLARALLARSMRMFQSMGFTQTSLGVDLDHAQRADLLYQSLGYQIVHLFTSYRRPVDR